MVTFPVSASTAAQGTPDCVLLTSFTLYLILLVDCPPIATLLYSLLFSPYVTLSVFLLNLTSVWFAFFIVILQAIEASSYISSAPLTASTVIIPILYPLDLTIPVAVSILAISFSVTLFPLSTI